MEYGNQSTKRLLGRFGGRECTDPDLVRELEQNHIAPIVGKLVHGRHRAKKRKLTA
jgi:hypothetical protein